MKQPEPEWYDVLNPWQAVIAGAVGFALMFLLTRYASHVGFVIWGYGPKEWKGIGTVTIILGFVVPYCLVRWVMKRR